MAGHAEGLEVRGVERALALAGGEQGAHGHDVVDVTGGLGAAGLEAARAERMAAKEPRTHAHPALRLAEAVCLELERVGLSACALFALVAGLRAVEGTPALR